MINRLLNKIKNAQKKHSKLIEEELNILSSGKKLPEQKLISRWYRLENPPKKLVETPYISYYYHETCFHGDGNCLMSNGKYKLVKNLQINDEVIELQGEALQELLDLRNELAQQEAEREAKRVADKEAKEAAQAKLEALGLTAEDLKALGL